MLKLRMPGLSREKIKLSLSNQNITYDGRDIALIYKEIDFILCSLHAMGSFYYDKERSLYENETTKFIDNSLICERLAAIRAKLDIKIDSQIGNDEKDDLERICESTPYWKKPGDYCKEIWI